MPWYQFRFEGGAYWPKIKAKSLREAWVDAKTNYAERASQVPIKYRGLRTFKPVYKHNAEKWKSITDQKILDEMKDFKTNLELYLKLVETP